MCDVLPKRKTCYKKDKASKQGFFQLDRGSERVKVRVRYATRSLKIQYNLHCTF